MNGSDQETARLFAIACEEFGAGLPTMRASSLGAVLLHAFMLHPEWARAVASSLEVMRQEFAELGEWESQVQTAIDNRANAFVAEVPVGER